MKKLYVFGCAGLILLVAAVSYDLYTFEPEQAEDAQPFEATAAQAAEAVSTMTVYKNRNCHCCDAWVGHLRKNGFRVIVKAVDNMNEVKDRYGVPSEMLSCHTGVIDGLVIEGHVPAKDILTHLDQRESSAGDKTLGLAVPGMPHGSPGMETGRKDDFAVLAFTADGESQVVNSYDDY